MRADPEDDCLAIARIGAVPAILRVITETTGCRLSLIARVTDDSWTCLAVNDQLGFGMKVGDHLDVTTTLCAEVRDGRTPVVIGHASQDPAYCGHPTPKLYGFESYIAVPIFLPGGEYFGNVCALDARPADLDPPRTVATMQLFAELIARQLDDERRQAATATALLDERQTAELREQFIAVLGHDIRSPLGAIVTGAELLASRPLGEAEVRIARRVLASAGRIARMVDDVLDFARGRLGGGIPIDAAAIDDPGALLGQVVEEIQAAHPARSIWFAREGTGACHGDPVRLAQLLSNLLANAVTHGPADHPVGVALRTTDDELILSVTSGGPAIPPAVLGRMFQPYRRGAGEARAGLGLGLYIVSEIVRSHGGRVEVRSTDGDGTTFTCFLPRGPAAPG